jgi:heptosyltransferase III
MRCFRIAIKMQIKRILVISTRQIGDVLLTTPLIHSLKQATNAEIDVLVFQGKGAILEGNPDLNKIIEIPERPHFKDHFKLFQLIYRNYDVAISTQAGDRPAIYAFLAAKYRIGMLPDRSLKSLWKKWLYQKSIVLDDWDTPTILQNLQLIDLLNISRYYQVILPRSSQPIEQLPQSSYAVFHLTPMWKYKRWTKEGWEKVAQWLADQNYQVVLTGSVNQEEQRYLIEITQDFPKNTLNLAGKLSFGQVAQLIEKSKVFIGVDTAVTHLAAATGVSTIALFGPTNPIKWSPFPKDYAENKSPFQRVSPFQINKNIVLIQGVAECVPCHQEGCDKHRQSHSRCLDELSAERVIEAMVALKIGTKKAPF